MLIKTYRTPQAPDLLYQNLSITAQTYVNNRTSCPLTSACFDYEFIFIPWSCSLDETPNETSVTFSGLRCAMASEILSREIRASAAYR